MLLVSLIRDVHHHRFTSQVVHCVMANAFKYTRKGMVTIDTESSKDGQYLTFRVVDTGTGFSAEQARRRFVQLSLDVQELPLTAQ